MNDKKRIVAIWLSRADQTDAAVQAQCRKIFERCKGRGYLPVVYRSGPENLEELTGALLCGNRRRLAAQDAEWTH